jgi:predicted DNA-binding transcriptional regulator YafY
MSTRGIIKRYSLIINFVKRGQKPSKEEICKMIKSEGLKYSPSSFDHDISAIRNEFGIEIVWDRYANGYFIDFENSLNIKETLKYFDMANSALIMVDTLKDGKTISNYLSLDSSENLTGIELMEPLITALKTKQVITFNHFSFQTEETKLITFHPYLLKEYKNRWFLFGENIDTNIFFIYGIERISNLVLTGNYFVPKSGFDPNANFKNVIGIATRPIIKGLQEQDFILSMTKEQGRYFKSLPWHPNHLVMVDNKDEFRVKLHLLPNYEFMQILYQYCEKVTVIEPQWLRDHLKDIFKTSSDKY